MAAWFFYVDYLTDTFVTGTRVKNNIQDCFIKIWLRIGIRTIEFVFQSRIEKRTWKWQLYNFKLNCQSSVEIQLNAITD